MNTRVTVRLAELADVDQVIALASRYHIDNLEPAQRAAGFISARYSRDWLERTITGGGLHVATADGDVVGFIAVTAPLPSDTPGLPPLLKATLGLAETLEFNGGPIAAQRYALRGPVCIDERVQGHGVYTAFNSVTALAYRDRFDIGVLFVSTENPRSFHTTTTKLGATPLAVFEVENKTYHFMAFPFRD